MTKKAADKILAGIEDAVAYVEGNEARGVSHTVEVVDVRSIRKSLGMSQARLSKALLIPVGTLRNWEQGRRQPEGPAKVLLFLLKKNPDAVLNALRA